VLPRARLAKRPGAPDELDRRLNRLIEQFNEFQRNKRKKELPPYAVEITVKRLRLASGPLSVHPGAQAQGEKQAIYLISGL